MHNALLSICLLLFPSLIIGQNQLSGIINSYTEVTDIDYCENSLVISTADGFEENMAAILIQMTGATINNSNTSDFGDIDNLGNTGHFEKCRIQSINGNTLILQNPLINQYDLAANIQLVSMPAFDNAEITETLIASVWNGQTGGVLALEITNTLTLNANIDASATGFPGGPGDVSASNNCSFTTNANDYFYALDNWRGAPKGSGIAPYLNDQEAGRGAQANGGGGGNDHNAGGGGGANISNGGRGGENREPSFFGCDGNFPGEGGKALQQDINRIFMGGGGGAGHENNNLNPTGGRGGGIVILEAAFIASNNQQILANGATPASINGDGAGGGGAGGTIVVLVDDGSGNLELIARGGNGGEANNNGEDRCMGPGGGGSGGRILTNINGNLNFTTDLSGGAAGQSINSSEGNCPNGPNGAQPGQDGISETIQQLPQSTEPNTPPNILSQDTNLTACDGTGINLSTEVEGFQLQFQWQIDTGSGFMDLKPVRIPIQILRY